jgi:hypothetical protein
MWPNTANDTSIIADNEEPAKPQSIITLKRHTTGAVSFGDVGDVCTETPDVDVKSLYSEMARQLSVLFAGGVAGSVGKTFTAPLSRLTILFQVHSMVSATHKDKFSGRCTSTVHQLSLIFRRLFAPGVYEGIFWWNA